METKETKLGWWSLVRNFLIALATGPYQLLILVVYLLDNKIPLSRSRVGMYTVYFTVVILSIISWVLWTKVYFIVALISAIVFNLFQAWCMYQVIKKG